MATDTLSSHPTPQSPRAVEHSAAAPDRDRLARSARRILRLNALAGFTCGSVLALGAGFLAPLLGLEQYAVAVPVVRATGVDLVLFAALLLWVARRPVPPTPAAMLAIGAVDALWVAASAALLISQVLPLSAAGFWTVVVQADLIALLAALELHTWWRMRS